MRIDWTQTLLGPEGPHSADDEEPRGTRLSSRAILLAGRMAGLLGAVLILAGTIAASPMLGLGGVRTEEMLAVAGLLVIQVIAFAMARRIRPDNLKALGLLCGVQLLLVAGLDAGAGVVVAVAGVVLAEQAAIAMLLKDRRMTAAGFAVAGLLAGVVGLLMVASYPFAAIMVAGIAIPALAMLPLMLARGQKLAPQTAKPSSLAALLDVALSRFPGPVLIVDAVGRLLPAEQQAMFAQHLRASAVPAEMLTETLLVVDRPVLLQALSRAIHDQLPSENLTLRMRGAPDSPTGSHYGAKRFSIWPVAGLPGRALVLISESVVEDASSSAIQAMPAGDGALIQRAMHDAVSPFNAGLGYLELIADPRLAPRDLASTRHYAQEARSALIEAHRNTVLMGRWLKLLAVPQPALRERVDLVRIAQDAARIFTSAESDGDEIEIVTEVAAHAEMPGDAARFAIGVLLRGALRAGNGVRLSISVTGQDAVIRARPIGAVAATRAIEDVFQMALEQAVQGIVPVRFVQGSGEQSLVLHGVAVTPLRPLSSDDFEAPVRGRLAS